MIKDAEYQKQPLKRLSQLVTTDPLSLKKKISPSLFPEVLFWAIAVALPVMVLLRSRGLVVIFPCLTLTLIGSALFQEGLEQSWLEWTRFCRRPLGWVWAALFVWMILGAAWALNPAKTMGTAVGVMVPCLLGFGALWAISVLNDPFQKRLILAFVSGMGGVLTLLTFEAITEGLLSDFFLGRSVANYAKGLSFFNVAFWPALGLLFYMLRRRLTRFKTGLVLTPIVVVSALLPSYFITAAVGLQIYASICVFVILLKWPRLFWVFWGALLAGLLLEPWIIQKICTLDWQAYYLRHFKASAQHRVEIWYYLSGLLPQFPWGLGMDGVRFLKAFGVPDPDFIHYVSPTFRHVSSNYGLLAMHPHNFPLQLWAELGIPGTFLMVSAVMGGLARVWCQLTLPSMRATLGATIAAASVPAMISYGAWQGWWIAALWLAAILFALLNRQASLKKAGDDALTAPLDFSSNVSQGDSRL